MQPIVVSWDGGVRFTADIRGHGVTVDQPARGGGTDSAPMPVELLPAALGTCVALYVQQFLVTRGLDPAGMTVEVNTVGAANPNRIGRFDVQVKIPGGVPEKYRDAVRRAAEGCTVHHTLTHVPEIAVRVSEGAGVGR
jgi:ribosomal protein S12 methylthiotransferase accessory factor